MEKMYTVKFKSGHELKILSEHATALRNAIISGCGQFQCFSDEESNEIFYIINMQDVSYIS